MQNFLNLLPVSLQEHYLVTETVRVPKEKTFDVKSYHKSNKNRSQIVYKKFDNCDKLNYAFKGQKHRVYKKF